MAQSMNPNVAIKRDRVKIAASNSSARFKSLANYICDGVGDEVQIRQAIKDSLDITSSWEITNPSITIPGANAYGRVWFDGTNFHLYYYYNNYDAVGHATSADGVSFTVDAAHNPVLSVGTSGQWDDETIAAVHVWNEGATWYMLYRGNGTKVGLATASSASGPFTKYVSNPVIDGSLTGATDCNCVMKVGSVYYLYISANSGDRFTDIYTSSDLHTWTSVSSEHVWEGGRFCGAAFKYGSYYYFIVNAYAVGYPDTTLELWRSTSPAFPVGDRDFLGVVEYSSGSVIDGVSVITSDITRSTFPNDALRVYNLRFSPSMLMYMYHHADIAAALADVAVPKKRVIELDPDGIYNISHGVGREIIFIYGIEMNGNGALLRVESGTSIAGSVIVVSTDSKIKNMVFDGNKKNCTNLQDGITVSRGGYLENVTCKDFTRSGFVGNGRFYRCVSRRNGKYGFNGGYASFCEASGNTLSGFYNCMDVSFSRAFGNTVDGIVSTLEHAVFSFNDCFENTQNGIWLNGVSQSAIGNKLHGNLWYGIYVSSANAIVKENDVYDNTGYLNYGCINVADVNVSLIGNRVRVRTGSATQYGIYCSGATPPTGLVAKDNNIDAGVNGRYYINTLTKDPFVDVVVDSFLGLQDGSTDYCHAAAAGTGSAQTISTGLTNPDVPRVISITSTGTHGGASTVTGLDKWGNTITEAITIVPGGTATGAKAFRTIVSYTIPATLDATDTLSLGIGEVFGLSKKISVLTGAVFAVEINGVSQAVGAVDTTNNTVAAAISATDTLVVRYKTDLNILA